MWSKPKRPNKKKNLLRTEGENHFVMEAHAKSEKGVNSEAKAGGRRGVFQKQKGEMGKKIVGWKGGGKTVRTRNCGHVLGAHY